MRGRWGPNSVELRAARHRAQARSAHKRRHAEGCVWQGPLAALAPDSRPDMEQFRGPTREKRAPESPAVIFHTGVRLPFQIGVPRTEARFWCSWLLSSGDDLEPEVKAVRETKPNEPIRKANEHWRTENVRPFCRSRVLSAGLFLRTQRGGLAFACFSAAITRASSNCA